jgi:hypothetical protein
MQSAYRSIDYLVAQRFDELAETRADQIVELEPLRRVYARRAGRTFAGLVGTAFGLWMFIDALVVAFSDGRIWDGASNDGKLTEILLWSWPAMIVAYFIARTKGRRRIDARLAEPVEPTGDAAADLARLESTDPRRLLVSMVRSRERWSVAMPLVALSLLTPLTLHWIVGQLIASSSNGPLKARDFDEWITVSTIIVGHAHVVLAICAIVYASKLRMRTSAEFSPHGGWVAALGITVLASGLPGVFLLVIPPILVALTGLVFVPAMYLVITRRVADERQWLALAEPA